MPHISSTCCTIPGLASPWQKYFCLFWDLSKEISSNSSAPTDSKKHCVYVCVYMRERESKHWHVHA